MLPIAASSWEQGITIWVCSQLIGVIVEVRPIVEKGLTVDAEASRDRHLRSKTFDTLFETSDVKLIILHSFDQRCLGCKFPNVGSNVFVIPLANLCGVFRRRHDQGVSCVLRGLQCA